MMRRVFRRIHLPSVLWLTVVWMMLWGDISVFMVITGLLAAMTVLVVFPLPRLENPPVVAPWAMVVLVVRFVWDLVKASIHVAWLVFRPGPTVGGIVMDIHLRCRDDLLQTITAEMVALVPGTVVIDLDGQSGLLTIHALDVRTDEEIEAVRQLVLGQEERVVRALGRKDEIERVLEARP